MAAIAKQSHLRVSGTLRPRAAKKRPKFVPYATYQGDDNDTSGEQSDAQGSSLSPVAQAAGVAIPGVFVLGASYLLAQGLIPTEPIKEVRRPMHTPFRGSFPHSLRLAPAQYFRASSGYIINAHEAGKIPYALERFFHGGNMLTVLAAMGGYGTYLGFQVRQGKREAPTVGPGNDTAGELHPKLMALMGLLFVLGANGGLIFEWLLRGEMLQSCAFSLLSLLPLSIESIAPRL